VEIFGPKKVEPGFDKQKKPQEIRGLRVLMPRAGATGTTGLKVSPGRKCIVFMAGEDLYYKTMEWLVERVEEQPL
jgi:hypothetical protein